jgi:hypothetical protein
MSDQDASSNVPKKRGRPFEKGSVPNPNGRPAGSRNKATIALEKLMEEGAEKIVQAVMNAAAEGDMTAAKLVLERIVPVRKGRVVNVTLPIVKTAADVVEAIGATVQAMADGEVTPEEASMVAGVLEAKRRAIETADLAEMVERLRQHVGLGQ